MVKFIIKLSLAAAIASVVSYASFLTPLLTMNAMNLLCYFALSTLIVNQFYGTRAKKESKGTESAGTN